MTGSLPGRDFPVLDLLRGGIDAVPLVCLGPFDGVWSRADYCFLGAVLAAAGAGLATCGLLGLRPRNPA